MKLFFTPEAEQQAEECDTWWRGNRKGTPDLFASELAAAKALVLMAPNVGSLYALLDGQPVRRVLMHKTGNHLYYVVDSDKDQIVVHSIWGGPKERGPKL
jgi:hypothetical protein